MVIHIHTNIQSTIKGVKDVVIISYIYLQKLVLYLSSRPDSPLYTRLCAMTCVIRSTHASLPTSYTIMTIYYHITKYMKYYSTLGAIQI